jgi:hypothetical protein
MMYTPDRTPLFWIATTEHFDVRLTWLFLVHKLRIGISGCCYEDDEKDEQKGAHSESSG